MRAVLVVSLVALLCPAAAMAQANTAPPGAAPATASPAAPTKGGDITRDDYVERAKLNAEKRFDRMDADHDGVLTADERRAYREAHKRHRAEPKH